MSSKSDVENLLGLPIIFHNLILMEKENFRYAALTDFSNQKCILKE